jgi:sugar phosphate isomerase/epimerase
VSHDDNDHSGGMRSVLRDVPTAWLLHGMPASSPLLEGIASVRRCVRGQRWRWDGVAFEILNPRPAAYADTRRRNNDYSCVLRIRNARHNSIQPPDVWGDGKPEGVRRPAARKLAKAAKAARRFFDAKPGRGKRDDFPAVVNGFTGSSIWHSIYAFPPTSQEYWEAGFADFAKRFGPILEEFEKQNVNFGLEVHPTEIAFDTASAQRAVDAVKGHRRFGFNYDPSHLGYQGVDYVKFIRAFGSRIFHVHMKDVWWGHGDGAAGVFGGHTNFGDARRFWDFRSLGHGDIKFEDIIVALNDTGYRGPLSVEWEDIRMDREHGATEAAAFVRKVDFPSSNRAFDAAFDRK